MKIHLDSNFHLLGSEDLESINLEGSHTTLRALLEELSRRSSDGPEYFRRNGAELSPGWIVNVNGSSFGSDNAGLDSPLVDGDRVSIKLELICGG
jgi:hypothetical protein